MTGVLGHYLDSIRNNLRLDRSIETDVMSELESHVEDELQELKKAGMSEEEALDTCVRLLGAARLVARQIYEAHSQGSWLTMRPSIDHRSQNQDKHNWYPSNITPPV